MAAVLFLVGSVSMVMVMDITLLQDAIFLVILEMPCLIVMIPVTRFIRVRMRVVTA